MSKDDLPKITADMIAAHVVERVVAVPPPVTSSLPVTFIDTEGRQSSDYRHASPCVEVVIVARNGRRETVWGCLDTGADYMYADTGLIARLGLVPTGRVLANGEPTGTYAADLHVGGMEIDAAIVGRPIRAHGQGFDMLLGRHFLNFGVFHYNVGAGNRCSFSFR